MLKQVKHFTPGMTNMENFSLYSTSYSHHEEVDTGTRMLIHYKMPLNMVLLLPAWYAQLTAGKLHNLHEQHPAVDMCTRALFSCKQRWSKTFEGGEDGAWCECLR